LPHYMVTSGKRGTRDLTGLQPNPREGGWTRRAFDIRSKSLERSRVRLKVCLVGATNAPASDRSAEWEFPGIRWSVLSILPQMSIDRLKNDARANYDQPCDSPL
jgi:hypothetical protein